MRKIYRHYTWRELLSTLIVAMFSFGAIGMACKFMVFYDHWVFFPWWPNIADSMIAIITALLLLYYKFAKSGQPKK